MKNCKGRTKYKKIPGLLEAKECIRFQFIKENQSKYDIKKVCKILKVCRSGFYEYLYRRKSNRVIENEALYEIIKEVFEEHKGRYGARQIGLVLEKMNKNSLIARGSRKIYRNYPKGKKYEEKENTLKTDKRNKIWGGDITYIHTKHGFLYLAIYIDIFSRKVVGWSMDTRIKDTLVLSALEQAIGRENPEKGLIIHTDRGSQYTTKNFELALKACGFEHSMSRKGNPYDNVVMESFYRTLKRELVKESNYDNPKQALLDILNILNVTTTQRECILH